MKFESLTVLGHFLLILLSWKEAGCEQRETPLRPLTNKPAKPKPNKGSKEQSNEYTYDPWRDNDRPKLFVDYLNGPLKGKPKIS